MEISQAEALEQAISLWIERDADLPEGECRVVLPSAYARLAGRLARVMTVLQDESDELVRNTMRQIEMSVKWLEAWAAERR